MQICKYPIPFFVVPVTNHVEVKQSILDSIATMGVHNSIHPPIQLLSNTDWHLSRDIRRPYYPIVRSIFETAAKKVQDALQPMGPMSFENCWFQQYNNGDYHNWHSHGNTFISAIYYVELDNVASKTTYRCMGEEFYFEVEEGSILFAPGFFEHKSSTNPGGRKTVVVQNFTIL